MSYKKAFLKELTDSYGQPRKSKSDYFWNENQQYVKDNWKPAIKWPQLEELIEGLNGTGVPIAGGAVLGCLEAIEFGDIDIIPFDSKGVRSAKQVLKEQGYTLMGEVESSLVFEHEASVYRPVQLIKMHVGAKDVFQVLSRFDLSCCQVAVVDKTLLTFRHSLIDIRDRVLRVTGTICTRGLLDRLVKYKNRGFHYYDEREEKEEEVKAKVVQG